MILGVFHDRFPRLSLTVEGSRDSLEVEFIVDTGFDGELTLPESLLHQIGATDSVRVRSRLADGSLNKSVAYRVNIEWDGELREVEAIVFDNNPLLGTALLKGCHVDFEAWEDGEVLIEPQN